MYFIRLMDEAINFFFDRAFLVWNKLAALFPPCLFVYLFCFLPTPTPPKVNLDRCNGIYIYSTCHLNKTFYQASLNLQSASFNL